MSLPRDPLPSFVARNPHLYGRPTVKESLTVPDDAVPEGEEWRLQNAIVADCVRRGWRFSWLRMDKPSTDRPGRPDLIIAASPLLWRCPSCNWCRPLEGRPTCSDCGASLLPIERSLWVECKTRTGKLDPDQRLFQIGMEEQHHTLYVLRSESEWERLAEGKV